MSKNQSKIMKEGDNSQSNPFEEDHNFGPAEEKNVSKKLKKVKKIKKTKKEEKKKEKKNKAYGYDYSDEDSMQKNSMFDDEAESGEEDFDDEQLDAEQGYRQQDNYFQQLYKRPNATQRLLERLEGKNEKEINAQYSRKALAYRQETRLYPSEKDPKMYVVSVKPKCQDQLVFKIMNKAKYFQQMSKEREIEITSVMSQKKVYPGKIFVQGYSAMQIKQFLDGFNDIYLGKKVQPLDNQAYSILFEKRIKERIDLKENTFVRIKKGLYDGDLGKILKVKRSSIDVLLVPRININQIKMNIQREIAKITDEQKKMQKKIALFKLYTDHKANNFIERPEKKQLFQGDFDQLKDMPTLKNIRMSSINGLIILSYLPHEVGKVFGTYLPIQILPFTTEGKFIEEIKDDAQNLVTSIQFKKGEEVEIISGALEKHYGILKEIKDGISIIQCKNKQLYGQILEEQTENISKRFKLGQRIKVVSGSEKGSTGVVIKILLKELEIFTDNQRSLMVSKRNVQFSRMETICPENVHKIKRFDLVRTVGNSVGIVIETTKDTVKIINTSNVVQVISNMDFEKKIETERLVGKNKKGDQITNNCLVFIATGVNKDKKCKVLHIFREYLFLFNQSFTRTLGIVVEMIDNCQLISKIRTGRKIIQKQLTQQKKEQQFNTDETGKKITVGEAITIKSGPLKGYKGIIKTITNDRVEIRIPSKCLTEWIPLKQLAKKNQKDDKQFQGKTPIRPQSGRTYEGFYYDN